MWRHLAPIVAAFLACAACNFSQDMSGSAAAVTQFHSRFNSENYPAIYAGAAADLRASTPEKDFTDLLAAVRRKLGIERKTASTGFFVNATTGGTVIRLNYNTTFAEGQAAEEFVFRSQNGKYLLLSYNINSPLLITR